MPGDVPVWIIHSLASRGYNADREAIAILADMTEPELAIERTIDAIPEDTVKITAGHVRQAFDTEPSYSPTNPSISTGNSSRKVAERTQSPPETTGSLARSSSRPPVHIEGDVTDRSTGTGTYEDFISVFRDRYERLSSKLTSRVSQRSARSLMATSGGAEAEMIGMINDIRSTANGHWLIELEDPTGTFPVLILNDKDIAAVVDELLFDEVIGVEGTLSTDGGILFVDVVHFPDIPRSFRPTTADRHVQAALISDVHVGSKEFVADAWDEFTRWLHSDEASTVEYLLIGGDMVEGVGVYPGQDRDLEVIDIYEQYECFAERLKEVPGSLEIIMIPGNHDAVRLAEPQPAFTTELREIMSAHDAHVTGNPSTVTIEGVTILMYHGVSLDEIIAELPDTKASYANPHQAMAYLLRKRHLAPQYGGHMRIAPEELDYLVIDNIPDVFHAGHVHTVGVGSYNNVRLINSGCWQSQTDFQRRNNLDPDPGFAPILDLDTLEVTIRKFS